MGTETGIRQFQVGCVVAPNLTGSQRVSDRVLPDRFEQTRIDEEIGRSQPSNDPFAAAMRMPMLITDPHKSGNPVVFVSDAFFGLTGYTRYAVIGQNCRFQQSPQTDRADVSKLREAIARQTTIELDFLNKRNGET